MTERQVKGGAMRTILTALLAASLSLGTVSAGLAGNGKDQPAADGKAKDKVDKSKTGKKPLRIELQIQTGGKSKTDGDKPSAEEARQENYIGVFTAPVSPALSAQLSELLKPGQGLLVTRVLSGSPAEKAGLKQHDVMATYDDQRLLTTDQLKKLVMGDKAGRTVKLGIVRAAKQRNVEVPLGKRKVTRLSMRSRGPLLRRAFPLMLRRRGVIGKGKAKTPDAPSKSPPTPHDKSSKRQYRSLSLSVTTSDNKQYKVQVNDTDVDGKAHHWQFEGTLDEIRGKLNDLPESIRDAIRRSLDRTDALKKQGRTFHFQLQPRIDGADSALRILMSRPAENGERRILELDLHLDGEKRIDLDDLLEIDELTAELKQLSPAIRDKIEATLRQVRVPEIRIGVQDSQ